MGKIVDSEKLGVAINKIKELLAEKLSLSGGTMTGNLSMGGSKDITDVRELKGNKITTTSTSETDPNVKVESLKVRDDRVDILKKTTTADDGSTSASSAAYVTKDTMELEVPLYVDDPISSSSQISGSSIHATGGQVTSASGMTIYDGAGSYDIYQNNPKVRFAGFDKNGVVVLSSTDYAQFIRRYSVATGETINEGLLIEEDGKVWVQSGHSNYLLIDPDNISYLNTKYGFSIQVDGTGNIADFRPTYARLRISDSCNFTGNVTNNEFTMVGNYRLKDVADHVTTLPEDTTNDEKAWLEDYLPNLFLDLKRNNNKKDELIKQLYVNNYDGSEYQLNMLIELSGGLNETVNVGDDVNVYICNNGDAYLAGSGATNDYTNSSRPLEGNETISVLYVLNGITGVGNHAFGNCESLTYVVIADSVVSIGISAFYSCASLKSITMSNSVIEIGIGAFEQCTSLKSILIPNLMTSIQPGTFQNCVSLVSITIPNSVTSISGSAFSGCSSLTEITIPSSVTNISSNAFYGCTDLTSITINKPQGSITGQPWGAPSAEIIWLG